ncbi:unnamed protein product [Boreogadus saida]
MQIMAFVTRANNWISQADDAGAPSEGGVASSAVMQREEDPAESGPVLGAEAAQVTSDASTATQVKLEESSDQGNHIIHVLENQISERWMEWTNSLERIKGFSVPRCLKPKGYGVTNCAELHDFADASESGYGSVLNSTLQQQSIDDEGEARRDRNGLQ